MTPQDIQRMFEEMGLGTPEEREAATQGQPLHAARDEDPSEQVFIKADCVSSVVDPYADMA